MSTMSGINNKREFAIRGIQNYRKSTHRYQK
jgi:hypothetical protein